MKQHIINMLSGPDNYSIDVSRALLTLTMLVFLVLSAYSVVREGKFEMLNFATAACAILFGGAAGVRIKSDSEPPAPPQA